MCVIIKRLNYKYLIELRSLLKNNLLCLIWMPLIHCQGRSCSFEDEVIVWAFPNSQKFGCCVFFMQEDASQKIFVLILSPIQISQMSWSRVTEYSKIIKNGDILNDLVKQLWSFLHTQFNCPWELFHFWVGLVDIFKDGCVVKGLLI